MALLKEAGHPYVWEAGRNTAVLTPAGTTKLTYGVPRSMWLGSKAWKNKWPCLIVDFIGLRGFSSRQIVEALKNQWPILHHHRIDWPERRGELYPEQLARQLELPAHQKQLGQMVRSVVDHIKNTKDGTKVQAVGFPAVLGIYDHLTILAGLEKEIGCPVFEIPTLPPGITGFRLQEALTGAISKKGVRTFYQMKVLKARMESGGFALDIGHTDTEKTVKAKAVVLATGRFIGQGLTADRLGIKETVFDLPVHQPPSRNEWHQLDLFDPGGHAVNRCGIETDDAFRPVYKNGRLVHPGLFAAGSILAHADWIRMKCGSGLAIASAYGAIKALLR
jgi:glycerol-3-phosphate dehydrogenase subunit B